MGLNVLKWVYNLGVKHERRRIAAFLQSVQSSYSSHAADIAYMLDVDYRDGIEKDSYEDIRKERLAKQRAVNEAVADIISELFHADEQYIRGRSIMFPEEDE